MRKYTAILFDLDGTLRANQPEGFEAFIEYASREGIALSPAQMITCERAVHQYWADGAQVADHLSRYDERGFWINYNQLLMRAMGVHESDAVAARIQDHFDHYAPQDVVFADAFDVLRTLHEAGYILGLVSNRSGELENAAEHYGLRQYFRFCLSGGQAHSFKPDAGIFQQALSLAGNVPPRQALYIGDNYFADIVGALNVGMDALLIDPHDIFAGYYDSRVKTLQEVLTVIDTGPLANPKQNAAHSTEPQDHA
jgi:putative hydrolase of the HAD superfamily